MEDNELSDHRLKNLGFVFQSFHLIPQLTVLENIEMPMFYLGVPPQERTRRAKELAARVEMDHRLMHLPAELSGGQRQRVALAMALMLEPKFIIADEPVSALDVTIQDQVLDLLVKLQQEMGLSILFITHDLRVAYQICSKVLIMKQGELREQGDPEVIYREPQDVYTRELLRAADIDIF